MRTAGALDPDHPEFLMFQRLCLWGVEALFAKAQASADAGDYQMAIKVRQTKE